MIKYIVLIACVLSIYAGYICAQGMAPSNLRKTAENIKKSDKRLMCSKSREYGVCPEACEKCAWHVKVIVIDTETTGLNYLEDDILQVSMVDGDGKEIINTYIKPKRISEWPEAMAINHITPEMVADAPDLQEVASVILQALNEADVIVGYNVCFDLQMLQGNGVCVDHLEENKQIVDVMQDFAKVYGEWDEKRQDYKWQKLETAAGFYDYKFKAHDSLEDARATLHVYKNLLKAMIKEVR